MTSFITEPGRSVQNLLAFLGYVSRFPDYPKSFVPPQIGNNNYVPPRHGKFIVPLCASTFGFASLFVFMRFYIRIRHKAFGKDDWVMLVAWICSLGFTMIQIMQFLRGGAGYHFYDLPHRTIQNAVQLEHWSFVSYVLSTQAIRFSVVFFMRKLTPYSAGAQRRVLDGTLVFQIMYTVIAILFAFLSCSPPKTIWSFDERLRDFRCLDQAQMILGLSIVLTVLDFWTLALPVPMVWHLELPRRSRIGLLVLFATGFSASACSIVRLFHIKGAFNSWDPTWNGVGIILWNQLEVTLGLIAACLPALNAILVRTGSKEMAGDSGDWRSTSDLSKLKRWPKKKGGKRDVDSIGNSDKVLISPGIVRLNTAPLNGRKPTNETAASPPSIHHSKEPKAEKDDGPEYITGGAFFTPDENKNPIKSWANSDPNQNPSRAQSMLNVGRPKISRETAVRAWSMRGGVPPAEIDASSRNSIRAATVGGRSLYDIERENEEDMRSGRDSFRLPPLPTSTNIPPDSRPLSLSPTSRSPQQPFPHSPPRQQTHSLPQSPEHSPRSKAPMMFEKRFEIRRPFAQDRDEDISDAMYGNNQRGGYR